MAEEAKPGGPGDAPKAPPTPKPPSVMAAMPWNAPLVDDLKVSFADAILDSASYLGQNFLVVRVNAVISILTYLKEQGGFDFLTDLTAVDWPKREARFDLIYN